MASAKKTVVTALSCVCASASLLLPLSLSAASTYSTCKDATDTSSAGGAYTAYQTFQMNATWMFNTSGSDIAATDAAVKVDSIKVYWASSTHGYAVIGNNAVAVQPDAYLVIMTPQHLVLGVSDINSARWAANGNSTFSFAGGVVISPNARYVYCFATNVSDVVVGEMIPSGTPKNARILGAWHGSAHTADTVVHIGDANVSSGDALLNYSINCEFSVDATTPTVIETTAGGESLLTGSDPVFVKGAVADGVVNVASGATVPSLTVVGQATTFKLADALTVGYAYLSGATTIDASAVSVSSLLPGSGESVKTTQLVVGAVSCANEPIVVLPDFTSESVSVSTAVSADGVSVTVTRGVDYECTISGSVQWSNIKPNGWVDVIVGAKPSITVNYEGAEPVTLTFDTAVQAGTLTLTGKIVAESAVSAVFGTVNAGSGSVVEMTNMTITTQSGSGIYRYRRDYPIGVTSGKTYEYVFTASEESPYVISDPFDTYGNLRIFGNVSFSDYAMSPNGALEICEGTTSVNSSGHYLGGVTTIRNGATFVNLKESDALNYEGTATVNVYGTLSMGNTRWTVGSGNTINIYGGEISGAGQATYGALDFINSGSLNVYSNSTVSAAVRFRNALTPVTVADGQTLTISGATQQANVSGGVTKEGAGTLKFACNPYVPAGITVEAGALAFDTPEDVTATVTYTAKPTAAMVEYATQSNWKGTVKIPALVSSSANDPVDASFLVGCGNENSIISLAGIFGTNTYIMASGNTTYNIGGVSFDGYTEFNNFSQGSVVNFAKITGESDLCLRVRYLHGNVGYNFNVISNYTGTLVVTNDNTRDAMAFMIGIGNIIDSSAALETPLLSLREPAADNAKDRTVYNFDNAMVNGVSTNLCVVRNDGIYIAAAKIGDVGYKSVQDAINARRSGKTGNIVVLDGTAEIPEGYINYNGAVVRKATIIRFR